MEKINLDRVNAVISNLKDMELAELRTLIQVLTQLHDAAVLSSKPQSK
jgi:hypothetical protein